MHELKLEVKFKGLPRPSMLSHRSIQLDEWTLKYRLQVHREEFIDAVEACLNGKVDERQYGMLNVFVLWLKEPLTEEEMTAINVAADKFAKS